MSDESRTSGKMNGALAEADVSKIAELPCEYPAQHVSVKLVQDQEATLGALLAVAHGQWPASARMIVDHDLDAYPELPTGDRDHHRRHELRLRLQRENQQNAAMRLELLLKARTKLYQLTYAACEKNAPVLAKELYETCNLSSGGSVYVGHWDGPRAYAKMLDRLNYKPTKMDKDFYYDAERVARETTLADGVNADAFENKAMKYCDNVNPFLREPRKGDELGEFLIDMMPSALDPHKMIVRSELTRAGKLGDRMEVIQACRAIVQEAWAKLPANKRQNAKVAAAVLNAGDLRGHDIAKVSAAVGMALSLRRDERKSGADLDRPGAFANVGKCSFCQKEGGHVVGGEERTCFLNPDFEGPLPPSVACDEERVTKLLEKRKKVAKSKGKTAKELKPTSEEAIASFQKLKAERAAARKKEGAPSGLSVPSGFLDNVSDITDLDGLCGLAMHANPFALPGDDDEPTGIADGMSMADLTAAALTVVGDLYEQMADDENGDADKLLLSKNVFAALRDQPLSDGDVSDMPPLCDASDSSDGDVSDVPPLEDDDGSFVSPFDGSFFSPFELEDCGSEGDDDERDECADLCLDWFVACGANGDYWFGSAPEFDDLDAGQMGAVSLISCLGRDHAMQVARGLQDSILRETDEALALDKPTEETAIDRGDGLAVGACDSVSLAFPAVTTDGETGVPPPPTPADAAPIGMTDVPPAPVARQRIGTLPARSAERSEATPMPAPPVHSPTPPPQLPSLPLPPAEKRLIGSMTLRVGEGGPTPLPPPPPPPQPPPPPPMESVGASLDAAGERPEAPRRSGFRLPLRRRPPSMHGHGGASYVPFSPSAAKSPKPVVVDDAGSKSPIPMAVEDADSEVDTHVGTGREVAAKKIVAKGPLPSGRFILLAVVVGALVSFVARALYLRPCEAVAAGAVASFTLVQGWYLASKETFDYLVEFAAGNFRMFTLLIFLAAMIAKASCLSVGHARAMDASGVACPVLPQLAPPRVDLLTEPQAAQLRLELLAGHEESSDVPVGLRALVICDSGCAGSICNHVDQTRAGSVRDGASSLNGAHGGFTAKKKCDMRLAVPTERSDSKVGFYSEAGCVFHPPCPYVLLAIGRGSWEQGISMFMPAWGSAGYFEYPNGVRVPLLNHNVLVVRPLDYKVSPLKNLKCRAMVTTVELGVPVDQDFLLFLCSGKRRDGDLGEQLSGKMHVVHVDVLIGGSNHKLGRDDVLEALLQAINSRRCRGLLASLDCRTWTSSHFLPRADGRPPSPMRLWPDQVLGVRLLDGSLPRRVEDANLESFHGAKCATAADALGLPVLIETPVCRREGTADYIRGCEQHAYMYDHPAWAKYIEQSGSRVVPGDQCMFANAGVPPSETSVKATAWLANVPIVDAASANLGKRCDHERGVHANLGAGAAPGRAYATAGSESYSTTLFATLAKTFTDCWESAVRGAAMASSIMYGKRVAKHHISHDFLHRIGNHGSARRLRHLKHAWADVEPWMCDLIEDDKPCEDCLMGDAPRLGPSGSLPTDEGLWFVDICHVTVKAYPGGERNIIGFKHAASTFTKTVRLLRKSQSCEAFELAAAFANSVGRPIKWIHCDGAYELRGTGVGALAKKYNWRITMTKVKSSNQNPIEPEWRYFLKGTRISLRGLPYEFWGWAFDHTEEGRALEPAREPPHLSRLERLLNEKPTGLHRRPLGCLGYVAVTPRLPSGTLVNKLRPQGYRGIHCGYVGGRSGSFEVLGVRRAQPVYAMYVPDLGGMVYTENVRFVPWCFPGLQRTSGGGWTIPATRIPFSAESELLIYKLFETESEKQGADGAEVRADKAVGDDADQAELPPADFDLVDADIDKVERPDLELEMRSGFAPEEEDQPSRGGTAGPKESGVPKAKPKAKPRFYCKKERWGSDYECNEFNGKGWEVIILKKTKDWAQCRFPNARKPDGGTWPSEWVPLKFIVRVDDAEPSQSGLDDTEPSQSGLDAEPSQNGLDDTEPSQSGLDGESASGSEPSQSGLDGEGNPNSMSEGGGAPHVEPVVELTPNHTTLPHTEGGDPLKEPSRLKRERREPERLAFSVAAMCAQYAEAAGAGFNSTSPRMPIGAFYVNTEAGQKRLLERACAHADAMPTLAGVPSGEWCEDTESPPTPDELAASFAALEPELQRAACIMMDHDDVVAEFGETSPQAQLVREVYAAQMVEAARAGLTPRALDPLLAGVDFNDPTRELFVSALDIFDDCYDGAFFAYVDDAMGPDIAMIAKKRSAPDIYTERQMGGREWDEPKMAEIATFKRLECFREVCADDASIKGMKVCECTWSGRDKRDAEGKIYKRKARCCLRGDLQIQFYNISPNQSMAPVIRHSSLNAVECVACLRGQHCCPFDVEAAYLRGKQRACEQMVVRPPAGFRQFDERGVEILWLMLNPLYGQADAGAIWNRTFNDFMTKPRAEGGAGHERCPNDPCVYSREDEDSKARVTLPLYVDDGKVFYDSGKAGEACGRDDLDRLTSEFDIKFGEPDPVEDYFLGSNRKTAGLNVTTLTCRSYIEAMVGRYLPGEDLDTPCRRFPGEWGSTPASDQLQQAFEAAVATRPVATPELTKRYGSLYGSIMHTMKWRGEICVAMNRLGACLSFPTQQLYDCMERVLVYLYRTRDLGVTYSKFADGANELKCYADSDWGVTRSTTGFCIMLGGASIAHASRRQHCITMSSCEAELVALCECAIELIYIASLVTFIGFSIDGPIKCFTDNKGAHDLCHRFTSAQNSRHVDRKLFKMREMRGAETVEVAHVPTESNPADLYTKILGSQPFARHRATVLGLAAGKGAKESRRVAGMSSDVSTSADLVANKRARAEMDVRGAVLTSAGRLWENAVWSAPTSSGGST